MLRRLFIFHLIVFFPEFVFTQTIEAGQVSEDSISHPNLLDSYFNYDGRIRHFLSDTNHIITQSFWVETSNGERRQLYVWTDKDGKLKRIKVVEGRMGEYEIILDSTTQKVLDFMSTF